MSTVVVLQTTFTPPADGLVKVRCTSTMAIQETITGHIAGAIFVEQGGTTTYGLAEMRPPLYTKQAIVAEDVFNVSAGSLVTLGLAAVRSGLAGASFELSKVEAWFTPT